MLGSLAVPEVAAEIEPMARWWPMEKLERSGRLVEHAQAVARRLGFEVRDAATGGACPADPAAGGGRAPYDWRGPNRRGGAPPPGKIPGSPPPPAARRSRRGPVGDRGGPRL